METQYAGGIYKISVWIMRFAYVNLLWITFTLLGLIVSGFFPATVAMFSIERKWMKGEGDFPIFQTFWKEYKQEFLNANILGFFLSLFGFLLFINYRLFAGTEGIITNLLSILFIVICFVYFIVLIYVFPVYVHYKVNNLDKIKNALLVGLFSPLMTLMIGLSVFSFYYIGAVIPGVIPVFTGSGLSFAVMWFSYCAFNRIEGKSKANQ